MTPQLDPKDFPRNQLTTQTTTATVQVAFGYRNTATDWEFRRLPLHGNLQEDFRQQTEDAASELEANRTGRSYDPQWDLKPHEFFYLSNDPPPGGNFFPQLTGFVNFKEYEDRRRIRQPNALVVVAQLPDSSLAYFGRRLTSKLVLERSSKILRLVYRDDAFDTLDDTVITFGAGFDWVAWQRVMIVLDSRGFHAMFRDIPALVAQVDANLATITKHIGIKNFDAFAARVKSMPGMMVKLQAIVDRADMHTRPPAVLKDYGNDFSIYIEWDGDGMIFDDSVEHQWNILRLLDEAHTLGPVTGKHWDSSSKVEV